MEENWKFYMQEREKEETRTLKKNPAADIQSKEKHGLEMCAKHTHLLTQRL